MLKPLDSLEVKAIAGSVNYYYQEYKKEQLLCEGTASSLEECLWIRFFLFEDLDLLPAFMNVTKIGLAPAAIPTIKAKEKL